MDALKQIPQVFFEFFARLVPGLVALTLWMALLGGAQLWPNVLNTVAAGRVTNENIVTVFLIVGISVCYVIGQLIAPFGKLMQRITEWFVALIRWVTKWFVVLIRWVKHRLREAETKREDGDERPRAKPDRKGDYDWLRANRTDLGALVAKIRAEYTMFYALSAIFSIALAARLYWAPPIDAREILVFLVFIVACAGRGFSVKSTCNDTAKKLRDALPAIDEQPMAKR
jgi:hypothetical protein